MVNYSDTIIAPATALGGAIAVIRLSGEKAISITDSFFRSARPLAECEAGTLTYGRIVDGNRTIDDVVVSVFRAPRSYTGEDTIEISCHGSAYIVSEIIRLATECGARIATAGEFTQRAFLAGRMALSQAEAVADLIASHDRASHTLATTQMRGGYAARLAELRTEMVQLGALLELELDFSEEDVEFADRNRLAELTDTILSEIRQLASSFRIGNALKNGIPVAIVGAANVGKSTLLNALLNDDRVIVSDIAGTTRDVVEERVTIEGTEFRFADTAGMRNTADKVELMGIERTRITTEKALVVLIVVDATAPTMPDVQLSENQHIAVLLNKCDIAETNTNVKTFVALGNVPIFHISALTRAGLGELTAWLSATIAEDTALAGATIVSNARHRQALQSAAETLAQLIEGIKNDTTADLLAEHLNAALYHIGTITGEITTDELLSTIFEKFCIGK